MNEQEPKKEGRRSMASREGGSYSVDPHRQLPQSPDAEMGVIGSIMRSPAEVLEICEEQGITVEHFHVPAHSLIYGLLMELHTAKTACDFITLTQVLRDRNQLDEVGGAAFVTALFTFVPTTANAAYYAAIIAEKYLLRLIILTCNRFAARAYEEQEDPKELCDDVQSQMLTLTEVQGNKGNIRHIKEGVGAVLENIEAAYDHRGRLLGLATGFTQFDRMTNGLKPKHMYVIAARPSMGKTALAMNIGEYVAIEGKVPVGVFSVEMGFEQLVERTICKESKISFQRVKDGFLGNQDFERLASTSVRVANAPMYIDDTSSLRILEFRAIARRMVKKLGVKLIIIDYLQLMRGSSKRSADNRQLEIAEISQGIKSACKELNIPIIVLAQLNRDVEKRKGSEPKMSDLRESGAIEQDADLVGLLSRPEYYIPKGIDIPESIRGLALLDIGKQRNGPVGQVQLRFVSDLTKFENRDENEKLYSNNSSYRQSGGDDDEEDFE